MSLQEKYDQQLKVVNKLNKELDAATEAAAGPKKQRQKYNDALQSIEAAKAAVAQRKKETRKILIGALLVIAELVYCALAKDLPGIVFIIGIALIIWGFKGKSKFPQILPATVEALSEDELRAKISALDNEISKYDAIEAKYEEELNKLNDLCKYSGKHWNFYTLTLDSSIIPELEHDMKDLMFSLGTSNDAQYIINQWFVMDVMKSLTATLNNDAYTIKRDDTMRAKLGASTSWIVVATSIAMQSISLSIMQQAWNMGGPVTFADGLAMSKARDAISEEELEFKRLVSAAVDNVVDICLKKMKVSR